jgi:class 3 adenylate cyclase/tetratricopeptide (TPR) repeat protein
LTCSRCQRDNPSDAAFCAGCGQKLGRVCAACQRDNDVDAIFCNGCGSSLAEPAPAPPASQAERSPADYTPKHLADKILQSKSALEGERKQVTVMFADVKGSMELASQVDPEAWHSILDRFFKVLSEGVHRFEGTVNQFTGDGIMALFGAPIAHEDHAQRACFAALDLKGKLQSLSREVKREHGMHFSVRIGLHSGDVVVGKIGDDLRMDYTAQGHSVGLAQRMEGLAAPDTCYLSGATASLVKGYFDLEDLGEFQIKSVAESVNVFELRGLGELRTRFDVSRARGLTRFVGRSDDMHTLDTALEQAQAGRGQVIGVVAEAGTGKSRLCFEFVERCRAQGYQVLEGQALAHGKDLPYLPMLQLFRAYYGIHDQDDDRAVREKIAGRLLLIDEGFREMLPVQFEFFGAPDPENPAPPLDPDEKKRQLFTVLRTLVQRDDPSARNFIWLIEDLHWMDPGSEEFLAVLVDAIAPTSRLLIVNFRPEYHADWMQKSYYRQLPIAPLGPDAIRELVEDLLGSDKSTEGLAAEIHTRTGGNPFFAEEVTQSLIESGHLEGTRGAYRLVTAIVDLEVPTTVQPLLASRIDRLAEREKHVLQIASVIGREFSEPVLAQVAALPGGELGMALEALKQGEFLYQQAIYPVAEYIFKHALTQEVALTTQLRERRAERHAAVARVIESLHADKLDEQAPLLAHHWEEAREPVVAAGWHLRAAQHVRGRDFAVARRHFAKVSDLTVGQEEDPAACSLAVQAHMGLLSLGFRLGTTVEEQDEIYAVGKRWAERTGDRLQQIELEVTASATIITAGVCDRALEHAMNGEALLEGSEDEKVVAGARYSASYVWLVTGQFAKSGDRYDELIAVGRRLGDLQAPYGGEPLLANLMQCRAQIEFESGDIARARDFLDEALRMARERNLPETEGWCEGGFWLFDWFDGDTQFALPHSLKSLEIAERLGSRFSIAHALAGAAMVVAHSGDGKTALAMAMRAVATARDANTALENEALHVRAVANAHLACGDATQAIAVCDEAMEIVERRGTWRDGPHVCIVKARALLVQDGTRNADAVRATLDRCDEICERTGSRANSFLATIERANLAELEGDAATCERLLREALENFRSIHANNRVAEIEQRLRSMSASS